MSVDELLARAKKPSVGAVRLHLFRPGKFESTLKYTVHDFNDFTVWRTPGVAAPSKAIQADPKLVYEYTNKWNTVLVVSDGARVLGPGDIGPKAGLPVMEGRARHLRRKGAHAQFRVARRSRQPRREPSHHRGWRESVGCSRGLRRQRRSKAPR